METNIEPEVTINDLEGVFNEVRKAYRLLYLYQRKILDLVNYIGRQWNFNFEKGEQYFCEPPRDWKRISTENWSWDFLIMYNHTWVFYPREFNLNKPLRLMINVVSDTGYFQKKNADKLNVDSFDKVDNSKSIIYLLLKTEGKLWKEKHLQEIRACSDFYTEDSEDGLLICKKYLLSEFADEKKSLKVLEDFESFVYNEVSIQMK